MALRRLVGQTFLSVSFCFILLPSSFSLTFAGTVRTLDESNFDAEVQSDVVLVDFWATWCGPCKMQAPIVEEVARRVAGKARVAKLDVDTAPKISQRFGVQAIPTLVIFRNGKPWSYDPKTVPPLALPEAYAMAVAHIGIATNRCHCVL